MLIADDFARLLLMDGLMVLLMKITHVYSPRQVYLKPFF